MNDLNSPLNHSIPTSAPNASREPTMSTTETLSGIFFEPERTFKALRERPRFWVAGLIIILAFMAFYLLFIQRIGMENIAEAQIRMRQPDATPEQIAQATQMYSNRFVKFLTYFSPAIGFVIVFAIGAGLYMLGAMAMAKSMSYRQALSVWVYSSLPPMVLVMIANIVLLFLKSPDSIDAARDANRGLVHANPSVLVDATAHPVLATVLSSIDLFQFYGLFLAALGLRKVARLSSGSAWGIALAIWLFGLLIRVAMAAAFGAAY